MIGKRNAVGRKETASTFSIQKYKPNHEMNRLYEILQTLQNDIRIKFHRSFSINTFAAYQNLSQLNDHHLSAS